MAAKATKMTLSHDSWRGTSLQLVELAHAVEDEIERAAIAAKKLSDEQFDNNLREQRAEYERNLRIAASLSPTAPLPPALQAQLAQAAAAAAATTAQQKEAGRKFITERLVKLVFGYTAKGGQFRSSQDPEFLKGVSNADGVTMRGNIFSPPSASISVTIQNRPWETVSLDVEGDDTDWVSSVAMYLNTMLSERESRVVRFLRNATVRGIVVFAAWILFLPTVEMLLRRYSINPMLAVPVSLLPAGLIGSFYQRLTLPFVITAIAPNALLEIAKAAISPLVGAMLNALISRLIGGKP